GPRVVAQDDDVLAAAELEHEVVTRIGNAALMIDHQPEAFRDEALIVLVVPRVEVVLGRDRGPLAPSLGVAFRDSSGARRRGRLRTGRRVLGLERSFSGVRALSG